MPRFDTSDSAEVVTPPRPGLLTSRRRFWLAVTIPIAITVFSQLEFVQQSSCNITFLPGIGACEVLADLIAPAWALAIFPIARRLRVAVANREPSDEDVINRDTAWPPNARVVDAAIRAARWGAGLIIVLAYTREWERFGEQPQVVWFVLVILATLALLAVPVWWLRDDLHARGVGYLNDALLPNRVDRFLFAEHAARPARWPHVLAFTLVTLVVAFTVLGQLDSLLRGMHLPGDPATGIGGIPGIDEFDLSKKPAAVVERVGAWRDYTEAVGAQFGSAYSVVSAHAIFDTLVTIPAYVALGVTLAFVAWRRRLDFDPTSGVRRAFELITLAGLVVLLITAAMDLAKNGFTWYVMDRAWNSPQDLTNANVRLLFFLSLIRTIGLAALAAACLLLLALAETPTRRVRRALVAVRSELLLLGVFAVTVLMLPQTADVIRGWQVTHTMVTVAVAIVLSMFIRWTAVTNLRMQHRHWLRAREGEALAPPTATLPLVGRPTEIGRLAAGLVVAAALAQLALDGVGLEVGRGLLVPAILLLAVGLFGAALPPAPYLRGDRPVAKGLRRRLPRMLGAGVYLVIGVAIVKAAASSVAYARNEDWWLFFALVPPLIGLWRILTRTTAGMGGIEAGFAVAVLVVAAVLIANGDPELSPAALSFAGITFTYGSLAFFNSYERTSVVNRISDRYLKPSWPKPFVAGAAIAVSGVVLWFYVDPIAVAPRVGTIGMVILAMMVLNAIGAGAVRLAELARPPRILAAFGVKRMPVVLFLGAWLLLAPAVVDQRVNNVRVIDGLASQDSSLGFDDVWNRWAGNNLTGSASVATGDDRRVVPLLLVSSSGGGIRAAAWTSFVLDCVFERTETDDGPCAGLRDAESRLERVAVMSGVSGGALGLAEYTSHVLDGVSGPGGSDQWVDQVLGDDYLAPSIGWLFFVDLPRSVVGFGTGISNRAEVMERTWEASWPDDVAGLRRGVLSLWRSNMPPLIFNGTSVNDGCRVNVSALDADGGSPEVPSCSGLGSSDGTAGGAFGATHDVVDFLCPSDDLALSTAAGMSARFPVVSVAGRLAADPNRRCRGEKDGAVFVVDGGYLEGSGAGTLLDSWEALSGWVEEHNATAGETCVVPFMLHIDNGYESPSVSGNQAVPREVTVPLLAAVNSSSGITAARAEAALAFEHPFRIAGASVEVVRVAPGGSAPVTSRYVRLVTRAHPGVQAPLGWTLSRASINDLRDQLAIAENIAGLAEVRGWLDGEMRCLGN